MVYILVGYKNHANELDISYITTIFNTKAEKHKMRGKQSKKKDQVNGEVRKASRKQKRIDCYVQDGPYG